MTPATQAFSCPRIYSCAAFFAALVILLIVGPEAGQAQTYSEIYHFTIVAPQTLTSTLVMDRAGRLYGTAEGGQVGTCGAYGMVFQLKPSGSGWLMKPLHCFTAPLGGNDGANPIDYGGLTFGPDGGLYGTTNEGGINNGTNSLGTVFKVTPPPTSCTTSLCPWDSSILYKFGTNNPDGTFPNGNVIFDAAGNMYGTTGLGGSGDGAAFRMTPSSGGWTESLIYSFSDGAAPQAGLVMDSAGNLYGTLPYGALGYGLVFQLSPGQSGWTENVIYSFTDAADGKTPMAGLLMDQAGNLYGATYLGGANNGGTVYELSPSGNGWNFQVISSLPGNGGPESSLTMDLAGNLFGTTIHDGRHQLGNIFELSPGQSGWIYTDLHSWALGDDSGNPIAGVTIASDGTLYGTANAVVWKITR